MNKHLIFLISQVRLISIESFFLFLIVKARILKRNGLSPVVPSQANKPNTL